MKSIIAELPEYRHYIKGKGTLDIGYPWLTIGAIVALEQTILQPHFRVLELGSGGSTVFWARRVAYVLSYETDPLWAERVRARLAELPNVCPVDVVNGTYRSGPAWVATLEDESFDLLLVDHANQRRSKAGWRYRTDRNLMGWPAMDKVKIGGWCVVDNYGMHEMEHTDWTGWKTYKHDARNYNGFGTLIAQKL
jgi:hypothetical protein